MRSGVSSTTISIPSGSRVSGSTWDTAYLQHLHTWDTAYPLFQHKTSVISTYRSSYGYCRISIIQTTSFKSTWDTAYLLHLLTWETAYPLFQHKTSVISTYTGQARLWSNVNNSKTSCKLKVRKAVDKVLIWQITKIKGHGQG